MRSVSSDYGGTWNKPVSRGGSIKDLSEDMPFEGSGIQKHVVKYGNIKYIWDGSRLFTDG